MSDDALDTGIWARMVYGRATTRPVAPGRLGVTSETRQAWRDFGIEPEPTSPLHLLMIAYDDAPAELKPIILDAAQKIHALTPLASCPHE